MEFKRGTEEEWEKLGIKADFSVRARIRGWILPSCPWIDAAERITRVIGRPAAELTKLISNQLDLYSLSPQEEAHKAFEETVDRETNELRVKHDLAMSAYTGSPVSPINEEVYKWASSVIETVKQYKAETEELYNKVASMPRLEKVGEVREIQGYSAGKNVELYAWYIPRFQAYTDVVAKREKDEGYWYGLYKRSSDVIKAYLAYQTAYAGI